jgi:hypothetical protein
VSLADVNPIRVRYRVGYVTPFTADSGTDTLTALNHTYTKPIPALERGRKRRAIEIIEEARALGAELMEEWDEK